MREKNILITGITGQDGIFLTHNLIRSTNHKIYGTSRQGENISSKNIDRYLMTNLIKIEFVF